jgi:endonuclease/exonuclease/phosphatase family metal-dependent hydrolase
VTAYTLMTWNVRYFGHGLGGLRATDGWIRLAARALARLDPLPDVVALQEVETTSLRGGLSQLPRFIDHLHLALDERGEDAGYQGLHFAAHRYGLRRSALYTTGLAVLVRDGLAVDAVESRDVTSASKRMRGLKQRRIAAHVRVRRPGSPDALDLFNTHLSLPAFLEVGPHRIHERLGHGTNQVAEAAEVLDFLDERRGEHAVVLGDLNAAPGTPAYRAFVDRGLVDAHRSRDGYERHASARFFHWLLHIDHVFSTPAVRWNSFRAHRIDERGPFLGLSDHAPKIGQLYIGR